jgi:hypothetical protein
VKDKTYNAEDLYWQTDGHLTPSGYRLWSEILSGFLIEKDINLSDKNK